VRLQTLSSYVLADIRWWIKTLTHNNGTPIGGQSFQHHAEIWTDATPFGGGGHFNNQWFSTMWSDWANPDELPSIRQIMFFELLAVVVALACWGSSWADTKVTAWTDNTGVVALLDSRTSTEPRVLDLLRRIYYLEALFSCRLFGKHISGVDNTIADYLSRLGTSSPTELPSDFESTATSIPWSSIPIFDPLDLVLPPSSMMTA
jgi:hypothetical protein